MMRRCFSAIVLTLLVLAGQTQVAIASKLCDVKTSAQLVAAIAKVGKDCSTIRLAPGQYVITKPMVIKGKNQINIIGSGWDTEIKMNGKGDALVFEDCGHCCVRDLMITGSKDAGSGIVFKGQCGSDTVDFCRIAAFPVSGIRYEGADKSPQSSNTVSRCHFISNLGDQLYSFNNNDFYILQNQFGTHSGVPKSGAYLERSSAGTYSMNYHWGNEVAFKLAGGSHYNRIENNRFEESRKEGVLIGSPGGWSCVFNIFTGNTIHTNSKGAETGKHPAVRAHNAVNTTFTSNQIFTWSITTTRHSSCLILESGCQDWIVKDNIFSGSTQKPLIYEEGKGHIVKDNIGE